MTKREVNVGLRGVFIISSSFTAAKRFKKRCLTFTTSKTSNEHVKRLYSPTLRAYTPTFLQSSVRVKSLYAPTLLSLHTQVSPVLYMRQKSLFSNTSELTHPLFSSLKNVSKACILKHFEAYTHTFVEAYGEDVDTVAFPRVVL